MIVLNGMVGLTLIVGALKHGEQDYNLKGASAYLSVIISRWPGWASSCHAIPFPLRGDR